MKLTIDTQYKTIELSTCCTVQELIAELEKLGLSLKEYTIVPSAYTYPFQTGVPTTYPPTDIIYCTNP
jgi:hypothetical protein